MYACRSPNTSRVVLIGALFIGALLWVRLRSQVSYIVSFIFGLLLVVEQVLAAYFAYFLLN